MINHEGCMATERLPVNCAITTLCPSRASSGRPLSVNHTNVCVMFVIIASNKCVKSFFFKLPYNIRKALGLPSKSKSK